ncbi:hypothetical protein LguiA_012414 [Lonicera macranthoides]
MDVKYQRPQRNKSSSLFQSNYTQLLFSLFSHPSTFSLLLFLANYPLWHID